MNNTTPNIPPDILAQMNKISGRNVTPGAVNSGVTSRSTELSNIINDATPGSNPEKTASFLDELKSGYGKYADGVNKVATDIFNPVKAAGEEIAKTDADYAAGNHSFGSLAKTGYHDTGQLAGAVVKSITAPVADAVEATGNTIGNNKTLQDIATSKVADKVYTAADEAKARLSDAWQSFSQSHPDLSKAIGDTGNIAQFMTLFLGDNPEVKDMASRGIDATSKAAGVATDIAKNTGKGIAEEAKTAGNELANGARAVKNRIAPTEPVDTTVAKAFQGKPGDTAPVKNALSQRVTTTNPDGTMKIVSGPLDLSDVKTHGDVVDAANAKLKDIIKTQDEHIDTQDSKPRKMQQLALDEGKVNGKSVVHNYVRDALDHLEELYTKTNDPVNLEKIKDIKTKLDPIKGQGLTLREVNNLARRYGSEFKDKAFSKRSGDPLTNINAQSFENTRTGLKNTVRNLLPDDVSRGLDAQYHNITDVRDLSQKMVDAVHDVTKRLQSKNLLQKTGALIGKVGKISGIGDIGKQLLGIENTPGASTMNALELQAKLPSYIRRIDTALKGNDRDFIASIKDLIHHPK